MSAAPTLAETDIGELTRKRLAGFLRELRRNGFVAGLREAQDAARILASPASARPSQLRPALRALLSSTRGDWQKFDEIFDAYWLGYGIKSAVRVSGTSPTARPPKLRRAGPEGTPGGEPGGAIRTERQNGPDEVDAADGRQTQRGGATAAERLARTDFRHLTDPEDQARAQALAERLARTMRKRITRRARIRRRGQAIALRETIHRSIGTGGVPFHLLHQRRRERPLRLVLLLDVSGSMSLYAAAFLRFLTGLLDAFTEAEAFLFHTRLVHVSSALREKDSARAIDRLALMSEGVGGGTRIGECLSLFNRWHARRVLNSRSLVMIISDGYDTGDPEALGEEMRALKRRARRIVWLNPMMGWDGFSPEARGLTAAMPHIDLMAPAHNLDSLIALEPLFARIRP
jgi:uncharacterized protein with von Willebrand factor type A (vWA) domain